MKKYNNIITLKTLTAFTILISRFLPLPPNFSPLGAYGFHSKNFIYFFAIILFFDLMYGNFYKGIWATYIGFSAYYFLGIIATTSAKKIIFIPIASILFYLISNLGVWMYWYPNDLNGLLRCYINALPFLINTLFSDMLFGYGYIFITIIKKSFFIKLLPYFNAGLK